MENIILVDTSYTSFYRFFATLRWYSFSDKEEYKKHKEEVLIRSIDYSKNLADSQNLKRIIKIVHREVRKKMSNFLRKNKHKKLVVLDIPLLLENKINKKKDILIFVESKKSEILKRLKKRKNFNMEILNNFKKMQLSLVLKKKKSQFIIKNNFKKNSVKVRVKEIIKNLV